jgi:phosphoribosylglycinamide formyltransferase-1
MAERPRFAVFASGRGSNADALMDLFESGEIAADLVLVLSNVENAPVIGKAAARGHPTAVVPHAGSSRSEHETRVLGVIESHRVGHILLAGYMRVLSAAFLAAFPGRILNIHPALLPEFRGLDAPRRQWEAGLAEVGATVHFVDEGVDTGPTLLQGRIVVRGDEGPDELGHRILTEVEHRIYPEAVRRFVANLEEGS